MKLQELNGQVKTSGLHQPTSFRINTNRKAFEILSSGLYSNKIAAVIRELCTNAADSMIAAGKKGAPFVVHLPNWLEPYFYVEDTGTGMSDDDVFNLYTTYFDSNRTRSNDFTGCLGLGSKSPFAYAQQFSVESCYEGVRNTYNCFINSDGSPTVAKMASDKTNDPDGVKVQLAVKQEDIGAFKDEAEEILHWFDPKPTVLGEPNFVYPEHKYFRLTSAYGIHEDGNRYHYYDNGGGKSKVIMGNVAYSLVSSEVRDLTPQQKTLVNYGIDLFMPIGSVEVAANREKLQYTPATQKAIQAAVQAAVDDCVKEVNDGLKPCKTIWEARLKCYELHQSILNEFTKGATLTWNGITVSDTVDLRLCKNSPKCYKIYKRSAYSTFKSYRKENSYSICADGTPIIKADKDLGKFAKTAYYLETTGKAAAYLITDEPVDYSSFAKQQVENFKDTGVLETAVNVSTLPKPPSAPRATGGRRDTTKVLKLVKPASNSYNSSSYWENCEIKPEDGGIYVNVSHYLVQQWYGSNSASVSPSTVLSAVNDLEELGKKVTVYGIRPHDMPRFEKHKAKWTRLDEIVKDVVTNRKDLAKKLELKDMLVKLEHSETLIKLSGKTFANDSLFGRFLRNVKLASGLDKDKGVIAYEGLCNQVAENGWRKRSKDVEKLEKQRLLMLKKYPMLDIVEWPSSYMSKANMETRLELMSSYIRQTDTIRRVRKRKSSVQT